MTDPVPSTYRPLWEAIQENQKDGNQRCYGTKNTRAYEAEYGEYTGQMEGELGWQEIQETNT